MAMAKGSLVSRESLVINARAKMIDIADY